MRFLHIKRSPLPRHIAAVAVATVLALVAGVLAVPVLLSSTAQADESFTHIIEINTLGTSGTANQAGNAARRNNTALPLQDRCGTAAGTGPTSTCTLRAAIELANALAASGDIGPGDLLIRPTATLNGRVDLGTTAAQADARRMSNDLTLPGVANGSRTSYSTHLNPPQEVSPVTGALEPWGPGRSLRENGIMFIIRAPMTLDFAFERGVRTGLSVRCGTSLTNCDDNLTLFFVDHSDVTIRNANESWGGETTFYLSPRARNVLIQNFHSPAPNYNPERFAVIRGGAANVVFDNVSWTGHISPAGAIAEAAYDQRRIIIDAPSAAWPVEGFAFINSTIAQQPGTTCGAGVSHGCASTVIHAVQAHINNFVFTDNTFVNWGRGIQSISADIPIIDGRGLVSNSVTITGNYIPNPIILMGVPLFDFGNYILRGHGTGASAAGDLWFLNPSVNTSTRGLAFTNVWPAATAAPWNREWAHRQTEIGQLTFEHNAVTTMNTMIFGGTAAQQAANNATERGRRHRASPGVLRLPPAGFTAPSTVAHNYFSADTSGSTANNQTAELRASVILWAGMNVNQQAASTSVNITPSHMRIHDNFFDGFGRGENHMSTITLHNVGQVEVMGNTFGPQTAPQINTVTEEALPVALSGVGPAWNGASNDSNTFAGRHAWTESRMINNLHLSSNGSMGTWFPTARTRNNTLVEGRQALNAELCTVEVELAHPSHMEGNMVTGARMPGEDGAQTVISVFWTQTHRAEVLLGHFEVGTDSSDIARIWIELPWPGDPRLSADHVGLPLGDWRRVPGAVVVGGIDRSFMPPVLAGPVDPVTGEISGAFRFQTHDIMPDGSVISSQFSRVSETLTGTCRPELEIQRHPGALDQVTMVNRDTGDTQTMPEQPESSMERTMYFLLTSTMPLDATSVTADQFLIDAQPTIHTYLNSFDDHPQGNRINARVVDVIPLEESNPSADDSQQDSDNWIVMQDSLLTAPLADTSISPAFTVTSDILPDAQFGSPAVGQGYAQFLVVVQADDSARVHIGVADDSFTIPGGRWTNRGPARDPGASSSVSALGNDHAWVDFVNPLGVDPGAIMVITGDPHGSTITVDISTRGTSLVPPTPLHDVTVIPTADQPTVGIPGIIRGPGATSVMLTPQTITIEPGTFSGTAQARAGEGPVPDGTPVHVRWWSAHSSDPLFDGLVLPDHEIRLFATDPRLSIRKQAFVAPPGGTLVETDADSVRQSGLEVLPGQRVHINERVCFVYTVTNTSTDQWESVLTGVHVVDSDTRLGPNADGVIAVIDSLGVGQSQEFAACTYITVIDTDNW